MNNRRNIIIIGAFNETVELCEDCGFNIVGIIDNVKVGVFMGYPMLGSDEDAEIIYEHYPFVQIVISPDNLKIKRKLYDFYKKVGFSFATVISPWSHVSKSAVIGEGSIIQAGVIISSNSIIGRFCKLNINATIMHDVTIGDFSIVAPCANILGRSRIGEMVYIGASATIEHDSIVEDETRISVATYFNSNENE